MVNNTWTLLNCENKPMFKVFTCGYDILQYTNSHECYIFHNTISPGTKRMLKAFGIAAPKKHSFKIFNYKSNKMIGKIKLMDNRITYKSCINFTWVKDIDKDPSVNSEQLFKTQSLFSNADLYTSGVYISNPGLTSTMDDIDEKMKEFVSLM